MPESETKHKMRTGYILINSLQYNLSDKQ
jgi:hypothetical protein